MFKKLFVLILTFGLGVAVWQLSKLTNQTQQFEDNCFTISHRSEAAQVTPQKITKVSAAIETLQIFQTALAKNDKEAVVSLINFPVDVEFIDKRERPHSKKIQNEKEFLEIYDSFFDDNYRKFISKVKAEQLLFSTSGEIFIYRSEIRMKPFITDDENNYVVKIIRLTKFSNYPNAN